MGISHIIRYLITLFIPTIIITTTRKMKLFQFLLPLLLVASVSSFSLKSLFSSEDKVEDVAAEDAPVDEVDEETNAEEETEEEEEEEMEEEEDEEEEELEEEDVDSASLEDETEEE